MQDKVLCFDDYLNDPTSKETIDANDTYESYLIRLSIVHRGTVQLPSLGQKSSMPSVFALVNAGRWMWNCLACGAGILVDIHDGIASPSFCPQCGYQGWVNVILPDNFNDIEDELLKQPGFRSATAFREWEPGWTMDKLRYRTERAKEQVLAGVANPRKASIGTTRLWSVGEIVTAANKNTFERGPIRDLAGRNGPIGPLENALVMYNATSTQRDALAEESGMMLYNSTTERFEGYDSSWGGFANAQSVGNIMVGRTSNNRTAQFHSVAHSLNKPPYGVHPYYVKISGSSEGGYSTGDSVSYTTMRDSGQGGGIVSMVRADYNGSIEYRWASLLSANDDYIHVTYIEDDGGATHDIEIRQKNSINTSGTNLNTSFANINTSNWRLRFIVFG